MYVCPPRKDMRTGIFNSMLIALVAVDMGHLIFTACNNMRTGLKVTTQAHTIMIPHFIYPVGSMFFTATIYMVVAISVERYHSLTRSRSSRVSRYKSSGIMYIFPIDTIFEQEIPSNLKRTTLYISIPLGLAVLVNIPRFFEMGLVEINEGDVHRRYS